MTTTPEGTTTPAPADAHPHTDKLAPFRALFGMPVAVQFAGQTPYIQVAPLLDAEGNPQVKTLPGTNKVIGLPGTIVNEKGQEQITAVAIGVLRESEDGSWLVIEERIGIPRSATFPGGQALMDVYVRPEMVTHVSFVRQVTMQGRPNREDA
jgi:hypothetical protein